MVFWTLQIGLSIMGIVVTMKVKEDKNGEEKRERDQIQASMNFSSQKTLFLIFIVQKGHKDIDNLLMS